jgi:hypothetical protein
LLFISPHPLYQLLGIRHEEPQYNEQSGRLIRVLPGINAEFFHGGAPSWAIDQALSNESFRSAWGGLPDGVNFGAYIGSYNTDDQAAMHGWDDETKEHVEQFMLNYQDYGRSYVMAVEPSEIADLPWPTYNELHHTRVISVAKEIGADFNKVLDYERKHKQRPVVIAALERELEENPTPDEELVIA